MLTRFVCSGGLVLTGLLVATPVAAQTVPSVHFGIGGFFPRGLDTRVPGDVLVEDLFAVEEGLLFDVDDFRGLNVFGEYNVGFGNHIEVGAGVGYYRKTVFSESAEVFDVFQDLRLRIVPVTGLVRFLPVGRPHQFQPYVGIGVSVLNWRYSEVGDFVDASTCDGQFCEFYSARFSASGSDPGAVVVYGVRIPIDGDIYGLTLEGRYQWGEGDTGGFDAGFLGDKIDLGGGSFNVGFLIRF